MKSLVLALVIITVFSCNKKEPDPAPVIIPKPEPDPCEVIVSTDTIRNKANFSYGITTTKANIIFATKTIPSGDITIRMIKASCNWSSVTLQIASPEGPGVYTDDASNDTYAHLNDTDLIRYETDILNGGTCRITITSLTENHIVGTFDFTASNEEVIKKVTGSFDCDFNTQEE